MKNLNKESKTFAFKLANKSEKSKKWQARDGVATAGCSGPDARGTDRYWGRDQGIWC